MHISMAVVSCPKCGQESQVEKNLGRGRRRRRCTACALRFDTVERPVAREGLGQVLISSDPTRPPSPFSTQRLREDLSRAVLRLLSPAQIDRISGQVTRELEQSLPEHARDLTDEEQAAFPDHTLAISDLVIRDHIERALRPRERMAHVMYALATRGRENVRRRRGFADAQAVLDWLYEPGNYPTLRPASPPTASHEAIEDFWTPPSAAIRPQIVIKRARGDTKERSERATPRFSFETFTGSIEKALAGRTRSEFRAEMIAEWVLWGLMGQRAVLTSQLSVGVMDALRRVDDVAYLRWAVVAKNIPSVAEFHEEALELIHHPSPRLRFDPDRTPRPRPTQTLRHSALESTGRS